MADDIRIIGLTLTGKKTAKGQIYINRVTTHFTVTGKTVKFDLGRNITQPERAAARKVIHAAIASKKAGK